MYVVPDTHLEFFQNLNIDSDYENTIYFPTTQAKDDYFATIPSIKTPRCTYQREKRGYCRVEIPIGQLYGRSYMRFRNNQFENKWFYAFVENVEYINDITTEVQYAIDVMMTWMGSYTIDQCFVERQHSETDNIGDNLVPENVDTSEMVHNGVPITTGHMTNWCYLVMSTPDTLRPPASDTLGFYSGWNYVRYDSASGLTSYLAGLSSTEQERVQAIFYVPADFVPSGSQVAPIDYVLNINKPTTNDTLDGYTPKNNKLYTYPYTLLTAYSPDGAVQQYKYELFTGSTVAQFDMVGVTGEQAQVSILPRAYNRIPLIGSGYIGTTDLQLGLTITSFQMCSWTSDTFKAFLAQQITQIPGMMFDLSVGAMATGMGLNPMALPSALLRTAGSLGTVTGKMMEHYLKPYEVKGNVAYQLATVAGYKDFVFYKDTVRSDVARRIDDYFTMFGYAQNIVAQPKINVRPYYTYVKTLGCHINGSFPEEDKRQIESIFNQGVRFWKEDHTHIGDYTVNNAPTGA